MCGMKPRFELERFPDTRVKFKVSFFANDNFWIHDLNTATWVPPLDEVEDLREYLKIVDDYNKGKKGK